LVRLCDLPLVRLSKLFHLWPAMGFLVGALLVMSRGASAAILRDVPLGECHGCEVTCFEDCSLKYDREILQNDDFLQISNQTSNQTKAKNQTAKKLTPIGTAFIDCLKEEHCPCPKELAKAAKKGAPALLQKNATCAVQNQTAAGCAQGCSSKVLDRAHTTLEKKKSGKNVKKQVFLEKDYPIHSVTVGVFAKGAMNMDQCLKFCLAATCGCDKAPGLDTIDKLFNAIKANDAAAPGEKDFSHHDGGGTGTAVADTPGSFKFRPAKIEECAKGMIGKKVNKGLWIDMGGGVGGELEICSDGLMERIFGPGDHSAKKKLCASTKSDDTQWGCIWNEKKGYCGVGFSPNLRCQKKYINDPSAKTL